MVVQLRRISRLTSRDTSIQIEFMDTNITPVIKEIINDHPIILQVPLINHLFSQTSNLLAITDPPSWLDHTKPRCLVIFCNHQRLKLNIKIKLSIKGLWQQLQINWQGMCSLNKRNRVHHSQQLETSIDQMLLLHQILETQRALRISIEISKAMDLREDNMEVLADKRCMIWVRLHVLRVLLMVPVKWIFSLALTMAIKTTNVSKTFISKLIAFYL